MGGGGMYLSYNEACAKECSSLEQDLKLCEKAGFDFIEIRLDMLREYLKAHSLQELSHFFESNYLKAHAINAVYLYPEFLSEQHQEEKRKEILDDFSLACEAGVAIGSRYIIIVPPLQRNPTGGPFKGDKKKTAKECVRILKELSRMAELYEMKLCFELVGFDRSSVQTIREADTIVREVDRENVGFVLDSYNIYLNHCCNDFADIGRLQPEKIFAVHLMSGRNVPENEMGQDKRCFCGQGVVDTDAFLQQLKKTGYNGMVSVETFCPEYWKKTPEWVISNAYKTTKEALEKNQCLSMKKE